MKKRTNTEQKLAALGAARDKRERRRARNMGNKDSGGFDSASFGNPSGPGVTYGQKLRGLLENLVVDNGPEA